MTAVPNLPSEEMIYEVFDLLTEIDHSDHLNSR
jgi:hypothetical protein